MKIQLKSESIRRIIRGGSMCLVLLMCAVSLTARSFSPPEKDFSRNVETAVSGAIVQDKLLTQATAAALLAEVTESIKSEVEDEEKVDAIIQKWSSRNLVGRTRKQAVQILLGDVRAVVGDEDLIKTLAESWSADEEDAADEKEEAADKKDEAADEKEEAEEKKEAEKPMTGEKPEAEEKAEKEEKADEEKPEEKPVAPVNPVQPPVVKPLVAEGEMIDLGRQPLSDEDMTSVMKWIAVRVGAQKLPYCYRQSFVRPPKPLSGQCAPGLEQEGGLCYQKCKAGYAGSITRCRQTCPSGYTDIGDFCQKPTDYGRGVGYGWKIGDTPFNYDGARDRCERDKGKGNCEKNGLIWYPKCAPGTRMTTVNFCTAICPSGWNDTGTGCAKPGTYDRGVGVPFDCAGGMERSGLLCYESCNKPGYKLIAGVCWQSCPSQQSVDCGAGCAASKSSCGMSTFSMVSTPIMAAISIGTMVASMGTSAAVSGSATAAANATTKAATSVGKLSQMFNAVKGIATSAKGSVQTAVGGAKNLEKLQTAAKVAGKVKTVATALGKEVNNYSKEFADNFDVLTSPEIAREIDSRFNVEDAYQIKRAWGVRHLELNLEANGISSAKSLISIVSVVDPTGLTAVVEAFLHPICKDDTPFPNIARR